MYRNFVKRVLDLIVAVVAILALSWVYVIIVLLYIMTFNFPIVFTQERIGRSNKPFRMYKFRTLLPGDAAVNERRFWLGDVLRFFSLDELPQVWNVIKGDMSLVGPRPLPEAYLPRFSAAQLARHGVRPGITGLAQVRGRHEISWEKKFEYDLAYAARCSFLLDLQILFQTILLLLSFRPDVSLEEPPFTGTRE